MNFDRRPDHHDAVPAHHYCPECNVCTECTEKEIALALEAAFSKGRESEFSRLMGASWPKGMREDILELLRTQTVNGEFDINWVEDSIGEMLTLATIKARTDGWNACREASAKVCETEDLDGDDGHRTAEMLAMKLRALKPAEGESKHD